MVAVRKIRRLPQSITSALTTRKITDGKWLSAKNFRRDVDDFDLSNRPRLRYNSPHAGVLGAMQSLQ
jgi:hypothetical protein